MRELGGRTRREDPQGPHVRGRRGSIRHAGELVSEVHRCPPRGRRHDRELPIQEAAGVRRDVGVAAHSQPDLLRVQGHGRDRRCGTRIREARYDQEAQARPPKGRAWNGWKAPSCSSALRLRPTQDQGLSVDIKRKNRYSETGPETAAQAPLLPVPPRAVASISAHVFLYHSAPYACCRISTQHVG